MVKKLPIQDMLDKFINIYDEYSFEAFCYELHENRYMGCFKEYYDENVILDYEDRSVIVNKVITWLEVPSNYIYKHDLDRFINEKNYWLRNENYTYLWAAGKNSSYPVPYEAFCLIGIMLRRNASDFLKILEHIYVPWMLMEFYAVIDNLDDMAIYKLLLESGKTQNQLILPSILDFYMSSVIHKVGWEKKVDVLTAYLSQNTETCMIAWKYMHHLLCLTVQNNDFPQIRNRFAGGIHEACEARINVIKEANNDSIILSADELWTAIFISTDDTKKELLNSVNLLLASSKEVVETDKIIPQAIHYDFAKVYLYQSADEIAKQWIMSWEYMKDNDYTVFFDPFSTESTNYRAHKHFLLLIGLALCELLDDKKMKNEFIALRSEVERLLRFGLQCGVKMDYERYSYALYWLTVSFGDLDFYKVKSLEKYPFAMSLTIFYIFNNWDQYSNKIREHETELKELLSSAMPSLRLVYDNSTFFRVQKEARELFESIKFNT